MFVPIIVMTAIAASSIDSAWMRAGVADDGVIHYINVDTLKRSGPGRVSIWSRVELPKPTFGKEVKSMRVHLEHDCLLHKQRYLQVVSYTGSNLTGNIEFEVGRGNWHEIEVNSVGDSIHRSVCRYR